MKPCRNGVHSLGDVKSLLQCKNLMVTLREGKEMEFCGEKSNKKNAHTKKNIDVAEKSRQREA